jgi:pyridoxamine 5'-phosphate oxidase-like protein
MTSWQAFAEAAPEFAASVRERFAVRKHCTMATLRKDGSPRISGTEVEFSGAELGLGSMPGALKARDLRRDPRVALHSPTEDPPEDTPGDWGGEAKIAGRVVELSDASRDDTPHSFRVDIGEVVLTRVEGDHLLIRTWHPDRGLEEIRRH